jgi:hypothetical protein
VFTDIIIRKSRLKGKHMTTNRNNHGKVEQADSRSGGKYHKFLKRQKVRHERRRAKANPECPSGYGKYNGYET